MLSACPGTPSEDPSRPPPRLDVLTDSDFCSEGAAGTESEAEHRLTDDMESSGVYSDAESRRSAEPDREPVSRAGGRGESCHLGEGIFAREPGVIAESSRGVRSDPGGVGSYPDRSQY